MPFKNTRILRAAFFVLALVFTLLTPAVAGADPSQPGDPARSDNDGPTGVFGGPAQPAPDPKTGTFAYSYRFELPAARGPAQPELVLTYSSSSHDREAGYGWGLDLPTIERRPLSGNARFDGSGSDERFYFNGQPLVRICTLPSCPNAPAGEVQPSWATTGWRYYRLQVDTTMARFYLSADGRQWRMQPKNTGTRLEFGAIDAGVDENIEYLNGDPTKIVRWRIARNVDVTHAERNTVLYHWVPLGRSGLLYLADISDTPRQLVGFDSLTAHFTQLEYESNGYLQTSYADVLHATPDQRLKSVSVFSNTWSSLEHILVRKYQLTYLAPRNTTTYDAATTAPLVNHSFLKQIQLFGTCGTSDCAQPPTTFYYEGGGILSGEGLAASPVTGADPNFLLPSPRSASVVDFNRDGLPDVFQSWNNMNCTPTVQPDGQIACGSSASSGRPVIGYLNRLGTSLAPGAGVKLLHQCMDAGATPGMGDAAFVSPLVANTPAPGGGNPAVSFFMPQAGVVVGGAWSTGVVMWIPDSFDFQPRAFFAEPTGLPSSGCDPGSQDAFSASWRWRDDWQGDSNINNDWAVNMPLHAMNSGTRWYADVDGDGLVDELGSDGESPTGILRPGLVRFTRRYASGEPGENYGVTQRPFDDAGALSPTQVPVAPPTTARFYYADVNGDGLVDLVTVEATGSALVRPGNGRGLFTCDPAHEFPGQTCNPPDANGGPTWGIGFVDSTPLPFTDDTFFHDVTGDGLADIVKYDPGSGSILFWMNVDGSNFSPASGNDVVAQLLAPGGGTFIAPTPHNVTFADMNADGIDDVVVLGPQGVWFWSSTNRSPDGSAAHGPRAGLLTRIDNGYGATTQIHYQTIQELDVAAEAAQAPWDHHSRAVESIVTDIRTIDTAAANSGDDGFIVQTGPYSVYRKVHYAYRDPAYDRWARAFTGFRKVRVSVGNQAEVTETTYWYNECHNDRLDATDASDVPTLRCRITSDRDTNGATGGVPVLVERFNPVTNRYLWSTKSYQTYGPQIAGDYTSPPDYRFASALYNNVVVTTTYDDAQPRDPNYSFPASGGADPYPYYSGGQAGSGSSAQVVQRDSLGNVVHMENAGLGTDPVTNTYFTNDGNFAGSPGIAPDLSCNADWECKPSYVLSFGTTGSVQQQFKKVRLTYTGSSPNSGDVTEVAEWLQDAPPLNRHHAAGGTVAPAPPGQPPGANWSILATFAYDVYGNVQQSVQGPNTPSPVCTTVDYDDLFGQFPQTVHHFPNGCGGTSLDEGFVFDRGAGVLVSSVSPSGGLSSATLDAFGRYLTINSPDPEAPGLSVLSSTISYVDSSPAPYSTVHRYTSGTSFLTSIHGRNALGEPIADFEQDDNGGWIISSEVERDTAGLPISGLMPTAISDDPTLRLAQRVALAGPFIELQRDYAGRNWKVVSHTADGDNPAVQRTFLAHSVIEQDAEQLKQGGPHSAAFTRRDLDGFGRLQAVTQHTSDGDVVTQVTYLPFGQPQRIQKSGPNGAGGTVAYERDFEFDSLGRLSHNLEPNSGNDWRYVYDDIGRLVGTSDARGCGKNIFYDGMSRVLGEDYSPCLASQAPYSAADLPSGTGLEVLNRYDTYEPSQQESDGSFNDYASNAAGQLVSVQDRGSYTRVNYDVRGRPRRTHRRPIKPLDFVSTGTSAYAAAWLNRRVQYDLADRPTFRSSGVDVPELLVDGDSFESMSYSARGLLSSITSSYGDIIRTLAYEPDGAVSVAAYGDVAQTFAVLERDGRRRLKHYGVGRFAPALWTGDALPHYTPPGAGSETTPAVLTDLHFDSAMDDVGNPAQIQDLATLNVPDSFAPTATKSIQYDDLYRVKQVDSDYASASHASHDSTWQSPYAPELDATNHRPVPLQTPADRVRSQAFHYDALGNVTSTTDDVGLAYDRSLGPIIHGDPSTGPNQLRSADGGDIQATYDAAGNLSRVTMARAGATCPRSTGADSECAQWFEYDWDEVGQLARARRWDFPSTVPLTSDGGPPTDAPTWDLTYAYSGGSRVLKTAKDETGTPSHTLEIFDSLRFDHVSFSGGSEEYERNPDKVQVFLGGGTARIFWDSSASLPAPDETQLNRHMYLTLGDHLGSAAVTIDAATSEMVERTNYLAFGATESDFRPQRWNQFREDYKFTGKEEDIEVGLTYFGARYYQPYLGRFASPDPLTVHGLGADLNPYAYVHGRVTTSVDPFGLDPPGCTACPGGDSSGGSAGGVPGADAPPSAGISFSGPWGWIIGGVVAGGIIAGGAYEEGASSGSGDSGAAAAPPPQPHHSSRAAEIKPVPFATPQYTGGEVASSAGGPAGSGIITLAPTLPWTYDRFATDVAPLLLGPLTDGAMLGVRSIGALVDEAVAIGAEVEEALASSVGGTGVGGRAVPGLAEIPENVAVPIQAGEPIAIPRALSPDEMAALTNTTGNIEFSQTFADGQHWLTRADFATPNRVLVRPWLPGETQWISHSHPAGFSGMPSPQDRLILQQLGQGASRVVRPDGSSLRFGP